MIKPTLTKVTLMHPNGGGKRGDYNGREKSHNVEPKLPLGTCVGAYNTMQCYVKLSLLILKLLCLDSTTGGDVPTVTYRGSHQPIESKTNQDKSQRNIDGKFALSRVPVRKFHINQFTG